MSFKNALKTLGLPVALLLVFLSGCGGGEETLPVQLIGKALKDFPTYSIILEDMKEEGNFTKSFFHKYRVVQEDTGWSTVWYPVSKDYYKAHENFLGMSLSSKKEGKVESDVAPPGYAYVGDSTYGQWKDDGKGGSFWEFYGKYALISSLMGGWYRPIYRTDFDMYKRHRKVKKPFFGSKNQYGTKGTVAKKAKPAFYKRKSAAASGGSSFKKKVTGRMGRTRTGFRGRAGGVGK